MDILALYSLSTLVTSVVLYSLTRATLMSPGKDETLVLDIYIYIYIYILIDVDATSLKHQKWQAKRKKR